MVQLSKDDGDSAPEDLNRFISSQEEMKLERTSSTSTPSRGRTDEILEYLEPRDWTDTLAISKAVVGNSGTQSDVNPLLYGLEKEGKLERRLSPSKPSREEWKLVTAPAPPKPAVPAGEHRQVHWITEDVQPAPRSQGELELEERIAEALEDPKSFRSLAQALKPAEPSPSEATELERILQVVRDLADERFAGGEPGVAQLVQIGSKAYDVDIHGSDSDYALKMGEIPIYDTSWERFVEDLGQQLSPMTAVKTVELRNKSAAILLHDTMPFPVLEIVPFNAHFDEESVPFVNLLGVPSDNTLNRAAADAMLKQLFEGYRGARDATRVAKAVFSPDTRSSMGSVPWGHLLQLWIYRACRSHNRKADFSGVDLFQKLLGELHNWPVAGPIASFEFNAVLAFHGQCFRESWKSKVRDRGRSLNMASRWATNRNWNLDPAFQMWQRRAERIRSIFELKKRSKVQQRAMHGCHTAFHLLVDKDMRHVFKPEPPEQQSSVQP